MKSEKNNMNFCRTIRLISDENETAAKFPLYTSLSATTYKCLSSCLYKATVFVHVMETKIVCVDLSVPSSYCN